MGKKRTMRVKKIAERLITSNPNGFTADFEANKSFVNEMMNFPSKVIHNKVAGHITRLKRRNSRPYRKRKRTRTRR